MRASAVLGFIMILIGLVLLYLLRHLILQLIVILVGVAGIVIAVVLIVIGFGLIFGWGARRRMFTLRVSASDLQHRDLIMRGLSPIRGD